MAAIIFNDCYLLTLYSFSLLLYVFIYLILLDLYWVFFFLDSSSGSIFSYYSGFDDFYDIATSIITHPDKTSVHIRQSELVKFSVIINKCRFFILLNYIKVSLISL